MHQDLPPAADFSDAGVISARMGTRVVSSPVSEPLVRSHSGSRLTYLVAAAFLLGMVIQAVGYLALGTTQIGMGLSECIAILQHLLAIGCAALAFRRARGMPSLFWLLFLVTIATLLIPNIFLPVRTIFGHSLVSDSTWRALYVLYGAPVLMMLILPDSDGDGRARAEIFLDLFQVALVVGLIFSTLFYLPLQQMLPAEALSHNLTISNLESLLLLVAVLVRVQFARTHDARDRLLRLGSFVLSCAVVTFIGNWIDQNHFVKAPAWWDLGWDVPIVVAGVVSANWRPCPLPETNPEVMSFSVFLGRNFSLITILASLHVLMDRWDQSHKSMLFNVAISATLLAFTVRLALTQYYQQKEISLRRTAQNQVSAANRRIRLLLDSARRQTHEITQINELGSLLQACSSPADAYRLISERLQGLFPGSSGSLALLNPSKNLVECVAEWGAMAPADQSFAPDACWALRRGCVHGFLGGSSILRCSHLQADGASVCIPLNANGTAIGTLAIQDEQPFVAPSDAKVSATRSAAFSRRRDLVLAVGEHIAISLANLGLRETLRVQAVRDPLTGLYNRRYMQEFLEREAQRAHRKSRPLSVMALDLDKFKSFNDTYGHAAGDHALRTVGEVLLRSVRADDFACRSGGEEFVMILPECNQQQAIMRAEQIRMRLRESPVEYQGATQRRMTVSIGVAALDETTDRVDRLLACADEALYEAKRDGRDRVVAARPVGDSSHRSAVTTQ